MKVGLRVVLMFGFEKKDMSNIKADELRMFRKAARVYLNYDEEEMMAIVKKKSLSEIVRPGIERGESRGKGI
jgi:hypothetical protein